MPADFSAPRRGGNEPTDAKSLLASIEDAIRRLHYYGFPPDVRLRDDVDRDVEGITQDVHALCDQLTARAHPDGDQRP